MKALILVSLSLLGALLCGASVACGVCIEDKIAATYDHAVVMQAAGQRHLIVFGEINGPVDMKAVAAKIATAAAFVHGIDRGTVRTSASPPAFSFALDPAARSPNSAVADLQRRLHSQGARLSVLRVVNGDFARNGFPVTTTSYGSRQQLPPQ